MSRIFDVVQAMSGQKNVIVIPRPYLEFFKGEQQMHALAAVLNQLVFWSGCSPRDDGWFYKEHQKLGDEVGGLSDDQVGRLVDKITKKLLPGVIDTDSRKVNGTPVKHYRIHEDALIAAIFPPVLDSAESRNGNREVTEPDPQNHGMETAESRNESREVAESYLYPDQHTDQNLQIKKDSLSQNSGESSDEHPEGDFLSRHPDAVVYNATTRKWGSQKDLDCAGWVFSRIQELHKKLGATAPKQPNWTDWANEIRLMVDIDGRTHREICELFKQANQDQFWQKNVLSPRKLREKWDELTLKLASNHDANSYQDHSERDAAYRRFIGSALPTNNPSQIEIQVRAEASKAGLKSSKPEFAMSRWNSIWKDVAQRQQGGKAA
ncbi:hypothetical protein F157LOC_00750 [Pectobacterium brasiliense]|uniref:replication protein 15 n=1 Tax=Pectobacterium brasiliense TaxID=180957 RepID=UPI000CE6994B|nr:replication protein 15 [Pectobacterium brasiliense]PPE61916.1 hypothetical protein F157LOC_00750 [Pectobacterium brasiliense]